MSTSQGFRHVSETTRATRLCEVAGQKGSRSDRSGEFLQVRLLLRADALLRLLPPRGRYESSSGRGCAAPPDRCLGRRYVVIPRHGRGTAGRFAERVEIEKGAAMTPQERSSTARTSGHLRAERSALLSVLLLAGAYYATTVVDPYLTEAYTRAHGDHTGLVFIPFGLLLIALGSAAVGLGSGVDAALETGWRFPLRTALAVAGSRAVLLFGVLFFV